MKTGALFAAATQLGALLNGASEAAQKGLFDFGMRLGTAYQIYDDCLDLAGDEDTVGKTLGSDLRRGKLTLPILHLLNTSSPAERERLGGLILEGNEEEIRGLVESTMARSALQYAVKTGRQMLQEAQEGLVHLDPSVYKESLCGLCETLDAMIAPLGEA